MSKEQEVNSILEFVEAEFQPLVAAAVAAAVAEERAAVVAYLLKVALAEGDWGIYGVSGAVEKGRHRE